MSVLAEFARPGTRRRRDEDEDEEKERDSSTSVDGDSTPRLSGSKRPRLDDEPTDHEDAEEGSEGELLPDSFRRSPKRNRSTANGLPNGHVTEDEPEKHQPGSIVRVKLSDFVTYTRAEFHPGPNLNMIIGPNGTGKSTLVCAICLGLGWATSHLGRAKDLGEFVKHGSKKAEIQIELAADPDRHLENPVITTRITKEGNKAEYFINGKKSTRKGVQELARSFSIQVDNLCQFLPQDRVVEFAALSPVDLLTHTQRAAAPEYMSGWHEQLKTLRKEQKQQQTEQQALLETVKHMENKQKSQEGDVVRLRERSELKEKMAVMEKLRPFPVYNEAKRKHTEALERKKGAKEELRQLERRIGPSFQASKDKETYLERVGDIVTKRRNLLMRMEGAADDLEKKIAESDTKIKDCETEIQAEKSSVKTTRTEIPRCKQDIQRIEKAMQTPPEEFDPAEMNDRIRAKMRQCQGVEAKIQELKDRVGSLNEQTKQRERIIDEKEKEKTNLHSQAGQQVNKLKRVSPDAAKAWEWIQNNRQQFRSDVFGPPIVECTLKDPRHAAAVETMIPDGDKFSFTVTSQQDMKMLLDQASRMRLHDINIRVSLQGMAAFRNPAVPAEQLRQFGLEGWLLDLIDGPEPVLAMLCDNRAIHQMAYATREITEQQFDALKRTQISSWVTPTQSYAINRRREYGDAAVSTRVQALKQARFFTDAPVDLQIERDIEAKIRETKGEIEELNRGKVEAKEEYDGLKAELTQLNKEKKEIEEEKNKKQRALSEFNGLSVKLDRQNEKLAVAEGVLRGYKERVNVIAARCDKLHLDKGQLTIDYANAVEQLRGLHLQLYEVEVMQIEARSDLDQLRAQHAEESRTLEERRREVETLTQESSRLREAGVKFQEQCQAAGADLDEVAQELLEIMNREVWMPDRLQTEIETLQARLDMTHGGANSENLIREFEARAKQLEEKRRKLNELDSGLEDVGEKIREVREQWEPELDELVGKISEAFKENFEQIQCVGEVGVYKDEEEFEAWAIQIRVKFRENEQLSILDSHRQSGGERAVSTIFFLMALQSLARAPFRVVDEINQGMDPRNERLVHSRMVDIACASAGSGKQGSQYFLITPKLLNGLKYHPKMKVHCIASGEYMPSDHRELDFEMLAKKALAIRRGREGGQVVGGAAA